MKNEIIWFLSNLFDLDRFIIFLIRDEECIDKKYSVKGKTELVDIVCKSLTWSTPEGVLVMKE